MEVVLLFLCPFFPVFFGWFSLGTESATCVRIHAFETLKLRGLVRLKLSPLYQAIG